MLTFLCWSVPDNQINANTKSVSINLKLQNDSCSLNYAASGSPLRAEIANNHEVANAKLL